MRLSLICPGIRPENWLKSYESIEKSFSGKFEVIFISPYELPKELLNYDNIKLINSFRSPIACQQQGLLESVGDYISWFSDDGEYLPGALDKAFELLDNDYKTIITGKYHEGNNQQGMNDDAYYHLWTHDTMRLEGVPKDALMLNCGIVSRQLLIELGGWDAHRFQVCPLAYTDFAVRAKRDGARFILQQELMFKCSHMPGLSGDHAPIHIAQTQFDQPIFSGLYASPNDRREINIDNWKESQEKWEMRFGR